MRLTPRIRCRQALRTDLVRKLVGRRRLRESRWRRKFQTVDSGQSVGEPLKHNLKSLDDFSNHRIERLIQTLSVIESARNARLILLIGPRNENDLLNASAYFDLPLECFPGLDLISYSRLIDLGDMHAMPYDNNHFDVVICGWTMSYSNQPPILANEMIRVCKPGGLIAIDVEYSSLTESDYEQLLGYSLAIPGMERINSVAQIHELFSPSLAEVFLSDDAPLKLSHSATGRCDSPSGVATIFSISNAD